MEKNLLIIGHSAKEYALAKILSKDFNIFVVSGNHAFEEFATLVDIRETSPIAILEFALENNIEFTICCSEVAIENNIASLFEKNNLKIFAPTASAGTFTTSKSIAKKLMYKLKIPTPRFGIFDKKPLALDYLRNCRMPVVVKTDNDKSRVPTMICPTENIAKSYIEECFFSGEEKIIIEEYVYGTRFSLYTITDGYKILPFGSTVDYKYSLDGDGGFFTAGMGSYSPCIKLTHDQICYILQDIAYPVINSLERQSTPYLGIIGIDGVLTPDGRISVLEFHPFLKDHDAQSVLSLIDSNVFKLLEACVLGTFADEYDYIKLKDEFSISAVLCSTKNKTSVIQGVDELEDEIVVSHLNTRKNEYLEYESLGDRALVLTANAKTLTRAKDTLYNEMEFIQVDGKHYRKDICKLNSY